MILFLLLFIAFFNLNSTQRIQCKAGEKAYGLKQMRFGSRAGVSAGCATFQRKKCSHACRWADNCRLARSWLQYGDGGRSYVAGIRKESSGFKLYCCITLASTVGDCKFSDPLSQSELNRWRRINRRRRRKFPETDTVIRDVITAENGKKLQISPEICSIERERRECDMRKLSRKERKKLSNLIMNSRLYVSRERQIKEGEKLNKIKDQIFNQDASRVSDRSKQPNRHVGSSGNIDDKVKSIIESLDFDGKPTSDEIDSIIEKIDSGNIDDKVRSIVDTIDPDGKLTTDEIDSIIEKTGSITDKIKEGEKPEEIVDSFIDEFTSNEKSRPNERRNSKKERKSQERSTDQSGAKQQSGECPKPDFSPCVSEEEADDLFESCCKRVVPGCSSLCRYRLTAEQVFSVLQLQSCPIGSIEDVMNCASNNKDVTDCCKTKGVSLLGALCTSLCNPSAKKIDFSDMKLMMCAPMAYHIASCFMAHLSK